MSRLIYNQYNVVMKGGGGELYHFKGNYNFDFYKFLFEFYSVLF